MIIGTAGHIDHGKSTLVTALTGRAMDRLAEERRRGITIDLGFAPLEVDGVVAAGIVDVPGHEDFVRTMVAGASGIDLVLLVVDAAEGIRPQTLEHLAVVEQLGIPRGIPVLTKIDLAEPDWIDLVEAELMERLERSNVSFQEAARVSAVTGQGVPELKERIVQTVRRSGSQTARRLDDLLRLPVDRAFAVAGVGTVVTGTHWSGSVTVGDLVRIEPGALEGRVRSVESHGRAVEHAEPGSRTAVGLAGIEVSSIGRGQTLLRASDDWPPTSALDVQVALLPGAPRALAGRTRVRVHLGTAEVMARIYPRSTLAPGTAALARLVLETSLVARGGDRFVLRSYSPVTTIGGGWVTDPDPPRKAGWPAGLAATAPGERLSALLERRAQGIPEGAVPRILGVSWAGGAGDPIAMRVGGRLLAPAEFGRARDAIIARLRDYHTKSPSEAGLSLETLRTGLGKQVWLADEVLRRLVAEGLIRTADGRAALASHRAASEGGGPEVEEVARQVAAAGLEGLTREQLAAATNVKDLAGALRIAATTGRIEAVEPDRYLSAAALAQVAAAIRGVGEGGVEVQPGALRDRIGLSRKHVIPFLEWADRKGITWRDREGRRKLKL